MITYLLKSSLCLALLLAFYHLVLEREKMHRFNRFYLLGSVLFSFVAPLYVIYNYVPTTEIFSSIIESGDITIINTPIEEEINYQLYMVGLYSLISLLLLFRFCKNLFLIFQKVKNNRQIQYKNATIVLVEDIISPHTFWNYIFINKDEYFSEEIEQELFTHELTHVIQKHTLDILLIEFLQILFWINPIFYFLKKAIKLNHEFLADNKVINIYKNTTEYQYLLLNRSTWNNEYYLASNLNYLLTKKRLQMMTKQSSKRILLLKKLAVLPLLIGSLFLFAQRVEAQEKANSKIVAEYNKLAKKYNTMPKNNMVVKRKDVERIEFLYKKLNSDQKKEAQPYPILPPPPPPAPPTLKHSNGKIAPPPPPPPAPKVIKGKSSNEQFTPPPPPPSLKSSNGKIAPPPPPPVPEKVATQKEVEEYNKLAKKHNSKPLKSRKIKVKDYYKMKELYGMLSNKQKQQAEPFPKFPPPPIKIDKVYSYKRMTDKVQRTSKNRKANLWFLKDLYAKMNAKERAKVIHPSKILDNKTSQIETIYEQPNKNSSKKVSSKGNANTKEEFGGVIYETGTQPKPEKGWTTINGETFYYVKHKSKTEYFNRFGEQVDKDGKLLKSKKSENNPDKGYIKVNNQTLFYVKSKNDIKYFNRFGNETDKNGKILNPKKTGSNQGKSLDSIPNNGNLKKQKGAWSVDPKVNVVDVSVDENAIQKNHSNEDYFETQERLKKAKKNYYLDNKKITKKEYYSLIKSDNDYVIGSKYVNKEKTLLNLYISKNKEFIEKLVKQSY